MTTYKNGHPIPHLHLERGPWWGLCFGRRGEGCPYAEPKPESRLRRWFQRRERTFNERGEML